MKLNNLHFLCAFAFGIIISQLLFNNNIIEGMERDTFRREDIKPEHITQFGIEIIRFPYFYYKFLTS